MPVAAVPFLAKVGSFLGSPGFSAGLSSAGNFLSGLGQAFGWGRPSLSAQLDVSKRLAKYEHDLSMDAWREQVAYNDPARQAERLEAAGFSRHNLVGNASIAGNASGVPAASVDTPDLSKFQRGMNPDGIAKSLNFLQDFQLKKAEIDLANAEVRNKDADTDQKLSATRNQDAMFDGIIWDNKNKELQNGILSHEKEFKALQNEIAKDPVIGDKRSRELSLKEQGHRITQLLNDIDLHEFRFNQAQFEQNLRDFGVNPNNADPLTSLIATFFSQTFKTYGISTLPDLIDNVKSWFNFGPDLNDGDASNIALGLISLGMGLAADTN